MREESIVIHPFEELRLEEYQGLKQVNEHTAVRLVGQIPFEKKDEYLQTGASQPWVHVTAVMEQQECTLFYGVVEGIRVEVKGGTCRMELVLKSGTVKMDYKERIRTFQSGEQTYGELLEICNQGYGAAKIMTVAKDLVINQFIIQYQETDWSFIKRLAAMNHTVVVADCVTEGTKYYFGLPDRKNVMKIDSTEYQTCCDIQEYCAKQGKGLGIVPTDTVSYVWESRDIYQLGDRGTIDGRQLFVWKIRTEMRGNILYHTYYMRPIQGFQVPVQYNSAISGVSLSGIVKAINEEKIQIEISGDENQEKTGARWFPYSTVYSSQDGTGWYCMPEIGDRIRLYFPTEQEQDAYAVSAYHESGADLRKNPECKFWRNREGQEIQLSPGKILLTNNNGSYIVLSDTDGIEIVSSGPVSLSAGGTLRISSTNSSIEFCASNKVRLKQGDTEMSLGGDLNMSGAQIKL